VRNDGRQGETTPLPRKIMVKSQPLLGWATMKFDGEVTRPKRSKVPATSNGRHVLAT